MSYIKGLVSVIIPTYNRKEWLVKTIESVQRQTYTNIEILICDDGSTDGTKERIQPYIEKDERIRYYDCGHNGRPAIPRNVGICNSKGEWIAFTDDDDVWNMTKLEAQLDAMKIYDVKACCTNAFCIEDGENRGKRYFPDATTRLLAYHNLYKDNAVICSSMVVHRLILDKCEGFSEEIEMRAIEDYGLWLRVICFTPILFLKNTLVDYLMMSDSSIRNKKKMTFKQQRKIVDNSNKEWLEKQDKDIVNLVKRELRKYRYTLFLDQLRHIKHKYFKNRR